MAPPDVRRLGPGDEAAARELNVLYGRAFEDLEKHRLDRPDDAYLARLLSDPRTILLVAERDGSVIGGLTAYELPKLEAATSEFYIYDLAVDADCRRQGVATALIEALGDIAACAGGSVIFVQADYGDDPAIALYTKLGTREDVMHFDIAIPRASTLTR